MLETKYHKLESGLKRFAKLKQKADSLPVSFPRGRTSKCEELEGYRLRVLRSSIQYIHWPAKASRTYNDITFICEEALDQGFQAAVNKLT